MAKMSKKSLKMSKKGSKWVKNGQKMSKIEFLYRGFSQYPTTFQESDKTRYTKASNVLDTSSLRR